MSLETDSPISLGSFPTVQYMRREATNNKPSTLTRPERDKLDNPEDNPHYYYAQKTHQSTANNDNGDEIQEIKSSHNNDNAIISPLKLKETLSEPLQTPIKKYGCPPLTLWEFYCYIVSFWAPAPLLSLFGGMHKRERQMAWREKIGLISIITYLGVFVAYITFGFTRTVCDYSLPRIRIDEISSGSLVINGKLYTLDSSSHPAAPGINAGTNVLYPPIDADRKDASFLFQNVNGNCHGLIVPRSNCTIPHDENGNLAWYFPCQLLDVAHNEAKPDFQKSPYYDGWACHTSEKARSAYYNLPSAAEVYYTWEYIRQAPDRNLVVYNGHILDLGLLKWLDTSNLEYPVLFEDLKQSQWQGYDLTVLLTSTFQKQVGRCLSEIIKIGEIDTRTVGCIASDVVLYVSLVFILSVVLAKFLIACYFTWGLAKKQGSSIVDNNAMARHNNEIEDWSQDIVSSGPIKLVEPSLRPRGKSTTSDIANTCKKESMTTLEMLKMHSHKIATATVKSAAANSNNNKRSDTLPARFMTMTLQEEYLKKQACSNSALPKQISDSTICVSSSATSNEKAIDTINEYTDKSKLDSIPIHPNIVEPNLQTSLLYNFPLIHTICFVTCYSEDEDGLRVTLDSLSTTDYPNSHKLIMLVCDGCVKGSGNTKFTPEIALDMMEDFVVSPEDVRAYSYVAVAHGAKRHNMAKVYSGFYKYNDETVPPDKQQRVPMIIIIKCGTLHEQDSSKPGNRGKRDSQVILMSFLQKITFNERMTEFEYQLLKNIWQITGLMADFYETVLMVDADTKVYPDSLTHMIAEMVKDPLIMGLCGETKIANKAQSWVTAIQVFEYYISHHQSKAFESVFGSVTCLPGCFSIYRIKSPKGKEGYWVPVLANPDIVERYSDNVTDTLHKKNLLLLGEDRYLSSLMLKTFRNRKQVFLPKAACKTIVPDTFRVLLSQRRRWINSTVHNLFELLLIRDLCGTFCFSMQFVIAIELLGTLVLPLAICFTIYVIIFAIVSEPTPIITLVLLALILGLPALIVIITVTRWSYLLWMGVYILALPIWNFVLPSYAYWKFDDFSWGETRALAGNEDGQRHDDGEGIFDHVNISMATWKEFENREAFR